MIPRPSGSPGKIRRQVATPSVGGLSNKPITMMQRFAWKFKRSSQDLLQDEDNDGLTSEVLFGRNFHVPDALQSIRDPRPKDRSADVRR